MGCLDDLTITNLVGNALPEPERTVALSHLDECRPCSELVAAMAIGSARNEAAPQRLAPGTEVDRYVIEHVVGSGAMGVVYAARDPRLDRSVALKCVAAAADDQATDRMVREAKAMAQLSHRNVVSIFDAGTFSGGLFLAMELVRGRTLADWLAERKRGVREIVAVLADAGRGLAAAHTAGIVHRDIKPHNVLIAEDGRVCVGDFGLARTRDAAPEPAPAEDAPIDALTASGQLLGTPLYMSPEQLAGRVADARSDQFAFCVVAYECFAGQRPFLGRTLAQLRAAIARGAPPVTGLPAWLQRVLDRGLAPDPAQRFASMDELLAALARDPAVRRRRIAVAGVLVVVGAGAVLAFPRAKQTCPDAHDRLAGTWDDARRADMQRAFAARPTPYTSAMLARANEALDRYADRWIAVRGDACRATYERRDQSEARYDAELACLDHRRAELAAAVDVLVRDPDEQTVRNAVALVRALPDVSPCRDGGALVDQTPLPAAPALRAQVEVVYDRLATAKALTKAAKYPSAAAIVDDVVPRARAIGFPPALAEALYMQGKLQMMTTRDGAAAERSLNEAATLAAASKDDALAAHVWIQLAYSVGALAHRFPEAASLGRVARAAIQRAGDRDDLVLDWHDAVGASLAEQGNLADALVHFREAAALAEPPTSAMHARLAERLAKLAAVLDAAGQFAEARPPSERAVALLEAELGPDHPDLAFALDGLGAIDYDVGAYADAQKSYRRALAILERLGEPATYDTTEAIEGIGNTALALGQLDEARAQHERVLAIREHLDKANPGVGDSLINLGMVLVAQGHTDEARANYDRALAIYRASYGPSHPQVAVALRHRAQLEMGTQAAIQDLQDALAITTAAFGPEHPEVATQEGNLGAAYAGLARWREAEEHYQRAVDLHDKTVGPNHEMTAMALTGLGQAIVERHEPVRAIPVLERALAIHDANHAPAPIAAGPRWFLARALWDSGRDRARAVALAEQARAAVAEARDPTSVALRSELAAWLAQHGKPAQNP